MLALLACVVLLLVVVPASLLGAGKLIMSLTAKRRRVAGAPLPGATPVVTRPRSGG